MPGGRRKLVVTVVAAAALFWLGVRLGDAGSLARWASDAILQLRSVEATVAPSDSPILPSPQPPQQPIVDSPGHLGTPPPARDRYPHIELVGPAGQSAAAHEFRFEGRQYKVELAIDERLYRGAASADRMISAPANETEAERYTDYYRYMVQDPRQAPLIAATSKKLRKLAKKAGLDRDRYAEFISKYVQSIPYDFEKLKTSDRSDRFPVQTLVDGRGVCGDKSLLLAALLAHEGYDVSLLVFRPEQHMAVGIRGPGSGYGDSGYLFVESTAPAYLSEIPENYVSGIKLRSDPLVIPIGTGRTQYESAEDVERILGVRSTAREAAETLYGDAARRRLGQAEANAVNARLNTANQAQSKLQVIQGREAQYLDRVPAIRWIDQNCWWD